MLHGKLTCKSESGKIQRKRVEKSLNMYAHKHISARDKYVDILNPTNEQKSA